MPVAASRPMPTLAFLAQHQKLTATPWSRATRTLDDNASRCPASVPVDDTLIGSTHGVNVCVVDTWSQFASHWGIRPRVVARRLLMYREWWSHWATISHTMIIDKCLFLVLYQCVTVTVVIPMQPMTATSRLRVSHLDTSVHCVHVKYLARNDSFQWCPVESVTRQRAEAKARPVFVLVSVRYMCVVCTWKEECDLSVY